MIERYSRDEMRTLWSDQTRYQTWLEVELAVCRAMEGGVVPRGTADQVAAAVTIDATRILEIEERVKHDVIAFLSHVEEQAGAPARWLHLGMTSSDVLDTSFALLLRRAGRGLAKELEALMEAVAARATETRDLVMVGRTHGIHAEPTTVGLVFTGFYAELERHRTRLSRAIEGISFGKISGAVGTYANISPEIEAQALSALGLAPEPCATQVVPRDRHAEFFAALAQLAASLERMAIEVRHWQRTEVGEAREAFGAGQKGSSAMPHKRNPILSENLCGLGRLVRSYAAAAFENVQLWHERDISHSSVERVIGPDATATMDFMLARMRSVVSGLVFDRARLERNLQLSGGLIFSEAVMLSMVKKGLARQRSYEIVQRSALAAAEGAGEFQALLAADPEVGDQLSQAELSACFDLKHHLRHAETIYDRVVGRAANVR